MMDAAVIWMGARFARPPSIYKAQLSLALPENDGRVSRCVGKLSARGAETGTGNFFGDWLLFVFQKAACPPVCPVIEKVASPHHA